MKINSIFCTYFSNPWIKPFLKKNVFYKEEIEDNLHKQLWEIIFLPCKILIAGSYGYDVR